jgi:uncharacterized membrane protein YdjX (TVP38/TMEM64 family)
VIVMSQEEPDRADLSRNVGRRSKAWAWNGRALWFIAALALAAALLAGAWISGAWRGVSLEEIRVERLALKAFAADHPAGALGLYVGLYAALVALSLPGALAMTLLGGFLFGAGVGGAAAVVAVSLGSVAMFLAVRTAWGAAAARRAAPGGAFQRVEAALRANAFLYLLSLRLMPAAPIWFVNIAASLVGMPLGVYVAATVLGVIPSTLIYASVGAGLDRAFSAGGRPDLGLMLGPGVYGPLALLSLAALAPALWRTWRRRLAALPNRAV